MDDNDDVLYNLACRCEALFESQAADLKAQASPAADLIAEYQQRFAIWAAHLGVFARRSQSLDMRLRNHVDIQDLVARFLDVLRLSLRQLTQPSEASGGAGLSREHDDALRDEALSAIDTTLSRLSRLGVTIRQSSRGRIDTKIQSFTAGLDLGPFAAVSQAVVQQLYPNAHPSLQQFLGKTMVDRYSAILFAKHRDGKLQSRRPGNPLGFTPTTDEGRQLDPGRHPLGRPTQGMRQQVLSRTLGAAAVAGISSSASQSDLSTINSQQLRLALHRTNNFLVPTERRTGTSSVQVGQGNYPRRPFQNQSSFFTCEWCSKVIQRQDMNDSDWRRHIDEDLKPYKCLSETCSDGHPAFPSFAVWLTHMKQHNRRWHQRVFPTSGWACAVCDDNPNTYTSPEALQSHMEQDHRDTFTPAQLPAIARQSRVERQRPWNECLLCCFTVEGAEPPTKRGKEQPIGEAGSKSSRTSSAMKHAKRELDDDQLDEFLDVTELSVSSENAETMARHIAAHLQALMLLTIRLVSVHDDGDRNKQDDVSGASVDPWDSHDTFSAKSTLKPAADTMHPEDVEIPDADDAALEAMDIPQDILVVPDAFVDFDGVPRQCDTQPGGEDKFLQKLIGSGAFQGFDNHSGNAPQTILWADDAGGGDDDADDGDDDADDGEDHLFKNAQFTQVVDDTTPTFEGFQQLVLRLNPHLSTSNKYLVDRIAHFQLMRYKGFLSSRLRHLQRIADRNCSSGAMCIGLGGGTRELDPHDTLGLNLTINRDSFPEGIPPPPTTSLGAKFECQVCFQVEEFSSPWDWTEHVYADIHPYVCTWEESCGDFPIFNQRANWIRHENEQHRHLEWWACDIEDCRRIHYRRDNFVQHLVREHKFAEPIRNINEAIRRTGHPDRTWAEVQRCRHRTTMAPQEEPCRFCGKCLPSWEKLTAHLAKHMEHIGLCVLELAARKDLDEDTLISPVLEPLGAPTLPPFLLSALPDLTSEFASGGVGGSSSPAVEVPSSRGEGHHQQSSWLRVSRGPFFHPGEPPTHGSKSV